MQRRALLSRWLEVTQLTGVSMMHVNSARGPMTLSFIATEQCQMRVCAA